MRLIDADELKRGLCAECTLYPNKCLKDDCDWDSIYHIDHAPTIEAIPVSFIEHQAEICEAIPAPFCARVYNQLLENWKKERAHETD